MSVKSEMKTKKGPLLGIGRLLLTMVHMDGKGSVVLKALE